MTNRNRREFLKRAAAGVSASVLLPSWDSGARWLGGIADRSSASSTGWEQVQEILKRVVQPVFLRLTTSIFRNTEPRRWREGLQRRLCRRYRGCNVAGGGRVTVPPGRYAHRPNPSQERDQSARRKRRNDPVQHGSGKYLPQVLTRFEGVELMGLSPLIYAIDCENIAVTGAGTLDGQSSHDHWWPWSGAPQFGWKTGVPNGEPSRRRLTRMRASEEWSSPRGSFGVEDGLRPALIQFYRCKNVIIGRFSDRNRDQRSSGRRCGGTIRCSAPT